MAYLYVINNYISNKLLGGSKFNISTNNLEYYNEYFNLTGKQYNSYERIALEPSDNTDISNQNNDLICHNFDVTRQMFSICNLQPKEKITNEDKINLLFKEIDSQLQWLKEYFKDRPLFITDDYFNEYIQMNVIKLCNHNPNYRRHFIKVLEELPIELIDLYGYQEIL